MSDPLIQQMGLLLTQLRNAQRWRRHAAPMGFLLTQMRYARRSLEDIERSTARYASFTFAGALSAGPKWGEPPMFGGALKVWIVNINDLAPSGPGLMEGLLGGVGRFFGGLIGGFAGGVISAATLHILLAEVATAAASIERIVDKLGLGEKTPAKAAEKAAGKAGGGGDVGKAVAEAAAREQAKSAAQAAPAEGGLLDKLDGFMGPINALTALFQAGAGDPNKAAATADPLTPGALKWIAALESAKDVIGGVVTIVKGLTLLLPEAIGSIALLLSKLDAIKLAALDLFQFILKEALLLRGLALTVVFDTGAAAARLAANILGILGETLHDVVGSVFKIFNAAFDVTLNAIQFLSKGLADTVNPLLNWLLKTVVFALQTIGQTPVFKLIVHAVQALPHILPDLILLVRGKEGVGLSDPAAIDKARKIVESMTDAKPIDVAKLEAPKFPDAAGTLLDKKTLEGLKGQLTAALSTTNDLMNTIFGDSSKALMRMDYALQGAASDRVFNDRMDKHIAKLSAGANALAATLNPASKAVTDAAANKRASGLDLIAGAYEAWLSSENGLKALLGNISAFVKSSPAADADAAKGLPGRTIGDNAIDRPRAIVEVDNLVIDLAPPKEANPPPGGVSLMKALTGQASEEILQAIVELMHEMNERGIRDFDASAIHLA